MSKVQIRVLTQEQSVLRVLERVLRSNGILSEQYSVGGYGEECVCLERTDHGWEVYDGERGQHYAPFTSLNLRAACLQMLDRLAESDVQSQAMQNEFRRLLRADSRERKKTTQALRVLRTGGARLKLVEGLSGLYPVLRTYASERKKKNTNTIEPPTTAGKVSEV